MEFQGLKCLSASCIKDEKGRFMVKLAVGHEDGRIELWTGEEAKLEKLRDPTKELRQTGGGVQGNT